MNKKSKPYELKEIKRIIEQRINVINKELTQNIEEDEGEGENQEKKEKLGNKRIIIIKKQVIHN